MTLPGTEARPTDLFMIYEAHRPMSDCLETVMAVELATPKNESLWRFANRSYGGNFTVKVHMEVRSAHPTWLHGGQCQPNTVLNSFCGTGILPGQSTGWKACATESEFLVFPTRFCFKLADLTKELVILLFGCGLRPRCATNATAPPAGGTPALPY
jgi:hypothetical protein